MNGSPEKHNPPLSDARISGMVATAVLVAIGLFVVWFVWSAA